MVSVALNQPLLLDKYRSEIVPAIREEFKLGNIMEVPRVEKIVINIGVKEARDDVKVLEQLAQELEVIAGQKPLITKAKKSISSFKLRAGMGVGLKVTLRGHRMYEFMERLFNVAMPRIRDFRGVSDTSFDKQGNYTLGIQDQTIFPEVEFDKVRLTKGMDITFVIRGGSLELSRQLLKLLGLPFKKKSND